MASTIEKAKETDPKELRAEVARLRRELLAKPRQNGHKEKPIDREQIQRLVDVGVKRAIYSIERDHRQFRQNLKREVDRLTRQFEPIGTTIASLSSALAAEFKSPVADSAPVPFNRDPLTKIIAPVRVMPARHPDIAPAAGSGAVSKSMKKILDALAAFEQLGISPAKRVNVAFFAGYTENGHFNNMVGDLRTKGFLDYPGGGTVQLTDAGRAIANADANSIQSLDDLHRTWYGKLSPSEAKLLRVLVERYPDPITRADLAVRTGYTENGHFNNMVGHLRNLGAADYPGGGRVVATDVLFPEGLA